MGFFEDLFDGLEKACDDAIDPLGLSEFYGGKDSPYNPFNLDPFATVHTKTKGDEKNDNGSFWDW